MDTAKYVFLDIDGTLCEHHTGIPESAKAAVAAARKAGHKVFLCTGRSKMEAESEISFKLFDGAVCSSGAFVEAGDKLLFSQPLAPSLLQGICTLLDSFPIAYNLEGYPLSYLNENALSFFSAAFSKECAGDGNQEIDRGFKNRNMTSIKEYSFFEDQEIYKISIFTYSPEICEKIRGKLPLSMNFTVNYMEMDKIYNAEISNRSATKATGIDIILSHFGAALSQTIGFGDSLNDEPMIRHCDIGVCMGNGDTRLKIISDYVCERVENDGILKAFRHFELIG